MLKTSEMICFALYSSTQAIQKVYRPLLDELGLTYPQYLVLSALWEADAPMTVGDLGNKLHLESNTLTPLLKRMEQASLVTRRRSNTDERRVNVCLTKAGRAISSRTSNIPRCIERSTGLDRESLSTLTTELQNLAASLKGESPDV